MIEYSNKKFLEQFREAREILELLESRGYKSYFVGGCVRDFLMNRDFADIDITTSAKPDQIKAIFPITIDTGIKHGTVTVKYKKNFYEITTFRSESDYVNHRAPSKVQFITTLEDDLERRDFTINAMTLDKDGNIFDFHNGLQDIREKKIRTVNDPSERFYEDALRMLRVFRFSSKLNFTIDEKTFEAVKNNAKLIKYISMERIISEFKKLLVGENNVYAFNKMLESGLNNYIPILNEIVNYKDCSSLSFSQAMFYLLDINNISPRGLKQLKLSNKDITAIKKYINIKSQFIDGEAIEKILYDNDLDSVKFVNNIYNYVSINKLQNLKLSIENFSDVNIDVQDIINLYPDKRPGKWIKILLNKIEYKILLNELNNNREDIIKFVKLEERS
ncbi:CCA tRNA nucleotidyltransferase [Gemella sp. GH3]|uniref:CCA tRNA nucleotidyltransferase n=1 Tax=unclassified Gemella TaxID=2624949 RepID=UPI0015CFA7B4|nr:MULTISPECIES: CCA tRNA nucleotidyltransferase [unclassified Gemella]MBF0713975.1 CCA tRNA nucleotidyltransferase [Gemella sp. GH3.1]NYS50927.1 CCA tRNA nucleotidyltransferase [Gemella sp. GH3]